VYQAQVAAAAKPSRSPQSWPETPPPEPSATSAAPPNASAAATQQEGEDPGHHRQGPEEQGDRGRRRQLDRIDERELVQEDPDQRRDRERHEVAPLDGERALTRVGERAEDQRGRSEAQAAVGDRLEPVRDHVLRDREVEGPERDRREEHEVGKLGTSHRFDATH